MLTKEEKQAIIIMVSRPISDLSLFYGFLCPVEAWEITKFDIFPKNHKVVSLTAYDR